ncbi:hypothetical protein IFT68_23200 [Oxalobacteraceae sp. CFBP 13730]|nr:hypothetical protein [Oxalobacteraceae sp. CFBP 13730]
MESFFPYIFVRQAQLEDSEWFSETSILWLATDVIALCEDIQVDPTRRIEEMAVFFQGRGDAKKGWNWIGIDEVWSATARNGGENSPVYLSKNGDYIDALGQTISAVTIKLQKKLYVAPTERV